MTFEHLDEIDALIVLTDNQQNIIKKQYGISNVFAIPHPCKNIDARENLINSHKAVYFARYAADKRHDIAIDAFYQVVQKIPNATLHCYGIGGLKQNHRSQGCRVRSHRQRIYS